MTRGVKQTAEIFWQNVDQSGGPDACWPWILGCYRNGYGKCSGPVRLAHRYAYESAKGAIPVGAGFHGTCVCHSCDNKRCCNPAHLFLGTQKENLRDMWKKGRNAPVARPGTRNGRAKLTEEDVVSIRTRAGAGEIRKQLAEEYNVSTVMISYIVLRKNWAHVE